MFCKISRRLRTLPPEIIKSVPIVSPTVIEPAVIEYLKQVLKTLRDNIKTLDESPLPDVILSASKSHRTIEDYCPGPKDDYCPAADVQTPKINILLKIKVNDALSFNNSGIGGAQNSADSTDGLNGTNGIKGLDSNCIRC
jgi:hypothetical protein